jgi:hypothetical protein
MTNLIHEYPEFLEIEEEITIETLADYDNPKGPVFLTKTVEASGHWYYDTPYILTEKV